MLDCNFEGTNWLAGGNTAWAKTRDVNGKCDRLYVIVKYKVDGFWYTSPTASSNGSFIDIFKNGADDAAGSHKATRYGVSGGLKNTL